MESNPFLILYVYCFLFYKDKGTNALNPILFVGILENIDIFHDNISLYF